jgi:hypothetical protein
VLGELLLLLNWAAYAVAGLSLCILRCCIVLGPEGVSLGVSHLWRQRLPTVIISRTHRPSACSLIDLGLEFEGLLNHILQLLVFLGYELLVPLNDIFFYLIVFVFISLWLEGNIAYDFLQLLLLFKVIFLFFLIKELVPWLAIRGRVNTVFGDLVGV